MTDSVLVVRIGPHRFGAPVACVSEILRQPPLTPLPRLPAVVAGAAVVRGRPLLLLDCRPLLGLAAGPAPLALRWDGDEPALVAVEAVEHLWAPSEPPLPDDAWRPLVPAALADALVRAYRRPDGWLWVWRSDLPAWLAAQDRPA